jgi:hypothetical protein
MHFDPNKHIHHDLQYQYQENLNYLQFYQKIFYPIEDKISLPSSIFLSKKYPKRSSTKSKDTITLLTRLKKKHGCNI